MSTVNAPAWLNATVAEPETTGAAVGTAIVIAAGQIATFRVNAPSGGTFDLVLNCDTPSGATGRAKVNGSVVASLTVPALIEEEEPMPAHSVTAATFSAPSGATATQADASPRTAPSTRYRVRIVNTHSTDRLYVAHTQAIAQATSCEVVEADYGMWESFVDAAVPIWVRPASSNAITVLIEQFATV